MTPKFHLDHATIVGYAAGTLEEAFATVAASHVALCPDCRKAVREAVVFAGEGLDMIRAVTPATEIVREMCADAEVLLRSPPHVRIG